MTARQPKSPLPQSKRQRRQDWQGFGERINPMARKGTKMGRGNSAHVRSATGGHPGGR